MPNTRQVDIPTIAEAHAHGIDSPDIVWEALGELRAKTFPFWSDVKLRGEAIDATLILSHAAWWLSHLKEDHGDAT